MIQGNRNVSLPAERIIKFVTAQLGSMDQRRQARVQVQINSLQSNLKVLPLRGCIPNVTVHYDYLLFTFSAFPAIRRLARAGPDRGHQSSGEQYCRRRSLEQHGLRG
jgi:hypothetical protein